MSILNENLKDFNYYKQKVPMYLRASESFLSHFKIWYDMLVGYQDKGIVPVGDTILDLVNIFADDFLDKIKNLDGSGVDEHNRYGTNSDFLDKLASLFSVTRKFSVKYLLNNVETKEELSLNNEELLILIKCQIIKNYSDGTYSQIKKFYEDCGLYMFILTDSEVATVDLILGIDENAGEGDAGHYSDNIKKMFLAGLLRVEHLGIKYRQAIIVLDKFLIWDSTEEKHEWDTGLWGL